MFITPVHSVRQCPGSANIKEALDMTYLNAGLLLAAFSLLTADLRLFSSFTSGMGLTALHEGCLMAGLSGELLSEVPLGAVPVGRFFLGGGESSSSNAMLQAALVYGNVLHNVLMLQFQNTHIQ